MRALSFLFPLALVAIALAEEDAASAPSDVLNLTADSFNASVSGEPLMLVDFFAPWCLHCKALAPHYEEAATQLKDKSIKLAKVDCVAYVELCQEWGIRGFPMLKVFRNGKLGSEYTGNRTTEDIVSFMLKQNLPVVTDVTEAISHEFNKADQVVIIEEDHRFGLSSSTDPAVAKLAGVTPPAIVLYNAFDDGRKDVPSEGIEHKRVEQFIVKNSMRFEERIMPNAP